MLQKVCNVSELTSHNVLVTGGCGSIGTELITQILKRKPDTVRVIDTNESGLFNLQRQFDDDRLRFLIGNIRDSERLRRAMEGIDTVFHAAALKHVELNEYNPFETIQTNVVGTQNLVRAALDEGVDTFVAISTDKASTPVSVMGATKLLSERLVVAANAYKGDAETSFGCVRFGNVLGSAGSVVPLFKNQIADGGPVTVTDPDMTRFIMPISEAADLAIRAQDRMTSGEVFVLKMPTMRIGDLADVMIEYYAPQMGQDPDEIEIDIIGARPAERVHEKLISEEESETTYDLGDMFAILPQIGFSPYTVTPPADADPVDGEYTSADQTPLTKTEMIDLFERTA